MGKSHLVKKKAPTSASWGAVGSENPPPVSPGRRRVPDAGRMVLDELAREPGISERLAAARVVKDWGFTAGPRPKQSALARTFFELRAKSAKEFLAVWERLEKEWEARKGGVSSAIASVSVEGSLAAEGEVPLKLTESDEELRVSLVELLRRHAARAKGA